jgi:hypothetical protein
MIPELKLREILYEKYRNLNNEALYMIIQNLKISAN